MIRGPSPVERATLDAKLEATDAKLRENLEFFSLYGRDRPLVRREYGDREKPIRTREWIERFVKIRNVDGGLVPLKPNQGQRLVEAAILKQERAEVPVRMIILKARKLGISTWIEARGFERCVRDKHQKVLIVAHKDDTASEVLKMAHIMRDNAAKTDGVATWKFALNHQSTYHIAWKTPTFGEMMIASAQHSGGTAPGRGFTPSFLHMCLAPKTPILAGNGSIVPACELTAGSSVLTHTGRQAKVTVVSCGPPSAANGSGRSIKIRPWLGHDIELTPNHPVFTQRGWVPAGELTLADRVAMPVREISNEVRELRLPAWPTKQKFGRGRKPIGAGEAVALDEEFGFAVGYYLAEGSVFYNNGRLPAGISFARHRAEGNYAGRACSALARFTKSRRITDRVGSLTTHEIVYGAALARMIEDEFGAKDQKRIPDWCFRSGKDFLRGILGGYLSGDGSKTNGYQGEYTLATVYATSIRSSLVTQARDIAASLGYGWGAIDEKEAGFRGGRNEKQAWTVRWTGRAARALRGLMGLGQSGEGRPRSEKAQFDGGFVWLGIKSLESAKLDTVYNVEVDHEDHSLRTLHFAVKNSEAAFFPEAADTCQALLNSMPKRASTAVFMESTANGDSGDFRDRFWEAWEERDTPMDQRRQSWQAIFLPWYWFEGYRWSATIGNGKTVPKGIVEEIKATLTDHEKWLLEQKWFKRGKPGMIWEEVPCECADGSKTKWKLWGVGWQQVSYDQLAWRRFQIRDEFNANPLEPSTWTRFQTEFPATAQEAFRATGSLVFDSAAIYAALEHTTEPYFKGELVNAGGEAPINRGAQSRADLANRPDFRRDLGIAGLISRS